MSETSHRKKNGVTILSLHKIAVYAFIPPHLHVQFSLNSVHSAWVGTASTGTAISSLSGAAATSAATAWLGGGALAAGGGGVAAGTAVLAAIPVVGAGIAVAGAIYGAYKFFKK